jgi:hypothetical protein
MKNPDIQIVLDNGEGNLQMEDRIIEQLVFDGLLYECGECSKLYESESTVIHVQADITVEMLLDSLSKVSF